MENKFYIGIVCHKKKILKPEYKEKLVLYTNNDIDYIDLTKDMVYTADTSNKDYVIIESLIPTDISEHRIDYMYLLLKYNSKGTARTKKMTH